MKFADFKCPKCGLVLEDLLLDEHIVHCCENEHIKVRMKRIFNPIHSRIIDYSLQYEGGSNKKLSDTNIEVSKSRQKIIERK